MPVSSSLVMVGRVLWVGVFFHALCNLHFSYLKKKTLTLWRRLRMTFLGDILPCLFVSGQISWRPSVWWMRKWRLCYSASMSSFSNCLRIQFRKSLSNVTLPIPNWHLCETLIFHEWERDCVVVDVGILWKEKEMQGNELNSNAME